MVYFSATFTTRKVVRAIGAAFGGEVVEHDITCGGPSGGAVSLGSGDLLVAGVPVYAGRVPAQAAVALRSFKGSGVPAVLVCVYGNRDYDDALVELQDIVEAGGFKTVAAGAFIARHCIFPKVAADRPDAADMQKIDAFAAGCARLLAGTDDVASLPTPVLKGNRPYKQGGASTFSPVGDSSLCDGCRHACASVLSGPFPRPTLVLPMRPSVLPAAGALWFAIQARVRSAAMPTRASRPSSLRHFRQGASLRCSSLPAFSMQSCRLVR